MHFIGVVVARLRHDGEFYGQVIAGILFLIHRDRRHLRIAQICFRIGAMHAVRQRFFLIAFHPNALALLAKDNRSAGILAHGQHAAGGDIGVFQQIERHEAIIRTRFRVLQNFRKLRQMRRAQQMGHILAGLEGKRF